MYRQVPVPVRRYRYYLSMPMQIWPHFTPRSEEVNCTGTWIRIIYNFYGIFRIHLSIKFFFKHFTYTVTLYKDAHKVNKKQKHGTDWSSLTFISTFSYAAKIISTQTRVAVHFWPDPANKNFKNRIQILLALTKNQFKHQQFVFISIRFFRYLNVDFFCLKKWKISPENV